MDKKLSKLKYLKIMMVLSLMLSNISLQLNAQNKRGNKEEIDITSSFKPSIVKSGKIEFQPANIAKDTSPYLFKYPFEISRFTTSVSPFTVKSLALVQGEKANVKENFIKLGYGNLQTPFVSLVFSDVNEKMDKSISVDHISSIGRLPDQKVSQSSILGSIKRKYSENQNWNFVLGYNRSAFSLYGFDHVLYNLTKSLIAQNFNSIHAGTSYHLVTGNEGQTTLAPALSFDYLSASRKISEFSTNIKFPLSLALTSKMFIKTQLDLDYDNLNDTVKGTRTNYLIKFNSKFSYQNDKLKLGIGAIPLVSQNKAQVLPDVNLLYTLNDAGLRFKAGVNNQIELNTMNRLYKINPFLKSPDSISLYTEANYFIGLDWINQKALQFNFNLGVSQFRNMPLFINAKATGRQFVVLQEPLIQFFHFKGGFEYLIDENMQFRTDIKFFSPFKQERYDKPFGFIPLKLDANFIWIPISPIRMRFSAALWRGSMALDLTNTNIGNARSSFRLKDAADLSLGVDYKLNKKWALWLDLNNIANVRYQRWNQYESFGFNFLAGIKFNFNSQQ